MTPHLACLAAALCAAYSGAQSLVVTNLGVPVGATWSRAVAISEDRSTIIGWSNASPRSIFRWQRATGTAATVNVGQFLTTPEAVSADGRILAGTNNLPAFGWKWTQGVGAQTLSGLSGQPAGVYDMSADGVRVVGSQLVTIGAESALLWDGNAPPVDLIPSMPVARALAISGDGTVVAGTMTPALTTPANVFRLTLGGSLQNLGALGDPIALNRDGTVLVGSQGGFSGARGWRWRASGSPQFDWLALLPGWTGARALDVSPDGSLIVGEAVLTDGSRHACMWLDPQTPVDLNTRLAGPCAVAWTLQRATSVVGSASDYSIVGTGDLLGDERAWLVEQEVDTDGDGISDDEELNGVCYLDGVGQLRRYVLDSNGDGVSDADPLRKDIFVEVDAMMGYAPSSAVIASVRRAFDQAPVPAPPVAGGRPGITLHVVLDQTSLQPRGYAAGFADNAYQIDKQNFGIDGPSERGNQQLWPFMQTAKRQFYRYCIFGVSHGNRGSSGLAELGGNDFIVTLGGNWRGRSLASFYDDIVAGTFMHELGHTLGLKHGGRDGANFKPNYFSVMNYNWQYPRTRYLGPGTSVGEWGFYFPDFSAQAMPTLNECSLDEAVGIAGPQNGIQGIQGIQVPLSKWASPSGCATSACGGTCRHLQPLFGPVDWDGDGSATSTSVRQDVNVLEWSKPTPTPGELLHGHDDWSNLQYDFRGSPWFAVGAVQLDPPVEMDIGTYLYLLDPSSVLVRFADGCPGSLAVSTLSSTAAPEIGQVWDVDLDSLPLDSAIVAIGFSDTLGVFGSLPFDLTPFGLPGCEQHVSLEVIEFVSGQSQAATMSLSIPNDPIFSGNRIFLQALVPDLPGTNRANAVVSDAGMVTIR